MSTRAEKMHAEHSAISAHHARIAKIHREAGADGLADEHDGLAARHTALAKCCAAASKADAGSLEKRDSDLRETIMKMVGEAIGNVVKPTDVQRVIPNAFGVTMVPRNGAPVTPAKPAVDSEFQKLFSVEGIDDPTLLTQ